MGSTHAMHGETLGEAALSGWRGKVASGIAGPVSRRSPVDRGTVEAVIGLLFFGLAVLYAVRTAAKATKQASDG